jgi:transposase
MKKTKKATPRYVGLDVHKHEITACLLDEHGQQITTERFQLTRSRLKAFAQVRLTQQTEVALEATTNSWAVADLLRPYVKQVVVSNPMATKAIAQAKVKTDKVDAKVLAHLLRCDYLPRVWEPDAETKKMRQLNGRRAALVQQRTAICNRIHSVLAVRLIEAPDNLFSRQGQQWLQKQLERGQLDDEAYVLITSDLVLLEGLEKQIDRFDQLLAEHAWQERRVRLLMTLPGVDVTVAESLLAALGDVSRFPTADHAAGYLGLVPSTRQSAAKCYRGPITKQGNKQARWMLIQSAQVVGRQPGPLGHFFRRIKRRKNHNVAVVAVARKLVVIAVHMLKNNEPYRYAQPKSTETKLARLRVRATGQKRRTGVPKGQKSTAKLPGGSRTVKSLDRVYAVEGLPPRQPLAPGEQRTVETHHCQEFVDSIAKDQIVPRRGKQPARQN